MSVTVDMLFCIAFVLYLQLISGYPWNNNILTSFKFMKFWNCLIMIIKFDTISMSFWFFFLNDWFFFPCIFKIWIFCRCIGSSIEDCIGLMDRYLVCLLPMFFFQGSMCEHWCMCVHVTVNGEWCFLFCNCLQV